MSIQRRAIKGTACFLVVMAIGGCSTLKRPNSHATINDVAVKAEVDAGYRLIAVDGKPVERLSSSIHTVIPFAVVPPGNHTLTLEAEESSANGRITVSANVEKGKQYRFAVQEGNVILVEDIDPAMTK